MATQAFIKQQQQQQKLTNMAGNKYSSLQIVLRGKPLRVALHNGHPIVF